MIPNFMKLAKVHKTGNKLTMFCCRRVQKVVFVGRKKRLTDCQHRAKSVALASHTCVGLPGAGCGLPAREVWDGGSGRRPIYRKPPGGGRRPGGAALPTTSDLSPAVLLRNTLPVGCVRLRRPLTAPAPTPGPPNQRPLCRPPPPSHGRIARKHTFGTHKKTKPGEGN